MIILLSEAAIADLSRLRSFLEEKDSTTGTKVVAKLRSAINSLHQFPSLGRPALLPDLRELIVPFGRSAYIVRYKYVSGDSELVILRVWHGRELRD